jgi:hypothetical protein
VTWKQKARHNLGEICVEREFKPSGKRRKRKKPTSKELNVKNRKSLKLTTESFETALAKDPSAHSPVVMQCTKKAPIKCICDMYICTYKTMLFRSSGGPRESRGLGIKTWLYPCCASYAKKFIKKILMHENKERSNQSHPPFSVQVTSQHSCAKMAGLWCDGLVHDLESYLLLVNNLHIAWLLIPCTHIVM